MIVPRAHSHSDRVEEISSSSRSSHHGMCSTGQDLSDQSISIEGFRILQMPDEGYPPDTSWSMTR